MEDFEDDFGDLYVNFEVPASSAINGSNDNNKMNVKLSSEDGPSKPNSLGKVEAIDGSDESGSEDDLNIVVNDEDCDINKFSVASRGSMKSDEDEDDDDGALAFKDFKYVRTHGSSIPSGVKASVSSSVLVRHDWNHSVRGQSKGPISGQVAAVSATPNLVMSQSRGFSLPWYRSILDVNIDTFEEKPWRYPGVDITDFFNFGFTEDSWKQYCNSVEHLRWSAFMQLGNHNQVPPNQEAGPDYDKRTMVDNISQSQGRAIEVEDSIGERQPSSDARRPRTLDSDVVIQITLENSSDTGDKIDHIGTTERKTSYNKESDVTDNVPVPHSNGDKGDEFSVQSMEKNDNIVDRCSAKTTACNLMKNDPDDTGKNQSLDVDGNQHKEPLTFSSDGTVESYATVNETSESVGLNACCADQCMVEPEFSLEEEEHLSLVSSCFESDSEVSGESNYLNSGKVTSPLRSSSGNSGAESYGSLTSYHKNLKGNHPKIKPVDFRDYSKCKIPVEEEQQHRLGRIDSSTQEKLDDNDKLSRSDAQGMYDRDHLSVHCGRWKEKLQPIHYDNKEDLACYKVSKLSHCFGGKKFSKNYVHTARKNYRKGSEDFYEERDPYLRQKWKKRGYPCEDEKRDGYWCQGGPYYRDRNPLAYKESGWFESQSKMKISKVQFRKSTNRGNHFSYHKFDSNFIQERYARPPDEDYERELGRNGHKDDFPLDSEGSWSRKTEHEFWGNTNSHYFPHQSYRESDGGRWTDSKSPRNSFSRSRFSGNYRRQASENKKSGWFDSYNNHDEFEDSFIFPDDQVHFRRKRRCGWKSEVLPWIEERTFGHRDEKLNAKKSSFFYKKDGRPGINPSTRGSLHDAMYTDDMQLDQHGFKMRRDGNSTRFIYGSRKFYRGKNEQTFLGGRDSVDLIVGKGKLSRIPQRDRNSSCSGSFKDTDLKVGQEPNTVADLNESVRYKVIRSNLPKGRRKHENEKVHDQFPDAVQKENLDIEEGQITTEEPSMCVSAEDMHNGEKRKLHDDFAPHGSKTTAAYDNQRILESIAKMEKRRERFKESITHKKEQEKPQDPEVVPFIVDTPEIKQQRPMRKRQWCVVQGS